MRLPSTLQGLRSSPTAFLLSIAAVNWFAFGLWQGLITNFGKEMAGFGGFENGLMQSVREIPGLLAVTALVFIVVLREQTFALLSLATLGLGIMATGFFPSIQGVLITTLIMSFGFHYYETMNQSLSLQLLPREQAPAVLGLIASAQAQAQILAYGGLALVWWLFHPAYLWLFAFAGAVAVVGALVASLFFGRMEGPVPQRKGLVLKRRYGLYYLLTLLSGARRQIFMAFGAFLLVERFGFTVGGIAALLAFTYVINTFGAPLMGRLIQRIGERRSIMVENTSLIVVFVGYAFAAAGLVPAPAVVAAVFFVLDGVFYVMTIALRTYFQKIASPEDIAPTAGVAFTINHIMAVGIPFGFGLVWMWNPTIVFVLGALIASLSLSCALFVPRHPEPGHETTLKRDPALKPAE